MPIWSYLIAYSVGCIALVTSLVLAFREWNIIRTLKRLGIPTEASVTSLEQRQWIRPVTYYAIYQFGLTINPRETITGRQAIGWYHRDKLKIGSRVTVRYLPSNPAISRLWGDDTDNTSRDMSLVSALLFIVILITFGRH